MSEYNEFSEERKSVWKSYVLKLLYSLYKVGNKELLWIVIQQLYEYCLFCVTREKARAFNVNDLKRLHPNTPKWLSMCESLVVCRNIATHRGFYTTDLNELLILLSEKNDELRDLICMFFEDEAKYFDKLLDTYALFMN